MKLPNWFKILWWALVTIALLVLLKNRFTNIMDGTANPSDLFLFVILVILVLLPLFQEFDIFGIKLKKEVADLKADVNDKLLSIKNEIHNIDVNTQVAPQFYLYPPPDHELPNIEKRVKDDLQDAMKFLQVDSPVDIQTELLLPKNVNYLFLVRYTIEKELRRIWKDRLQGEESRRPVPVYQIARMLVDADLINDRLAHAIREVYAICSPAIHGEPISDKHVAFARDVAPELIATLMAIK